MVDLCAMCGASIGMYCTAIPFEDGRVYHEYCYPQEELVDGFHKAIMEHGGLVWCHRHQRVSKVRTYAKANSSLEARAPGLCPHMSRQVTFPGGSKFVPKLCVGKRCELMKQHRCGPKTHVHSGLGDYIIIEMPEKPSKQFMNELRDVFKDTGILPLITLPMASEATEAPLVGQQVLPPEDKKEED